MTDSLTADDVLIIESALVPKSLYASGAIKADDIASSDYAYICGEPPRIYLLVKRQCFDRRFGWIGWIYRVAGESPFVEANSRACWKHRTTRDAFKYVVIHGCIGGKSWDYIRQHTLHYEPARHPVLDNVYGHVGTNRVIIRVDEYLVKHGRAHEVMYFDGDDNVLMRDIIIFSLRWLGPEGSPVPVAVIGFHNWICWRSANGVVDYLRHDLDTMTMVKHMNVLRRILGG